MWVLNGGNASEMAENKLAAQHSPPTQGPTGVKSTLWTPRAQYKWDRSHNFSRRDALHSLSNDGVGTAAEIPLDCVPAVDNC